HVVDAVEVQAHHSVPLLAVAVLEGVMDGAAGVVQQDLDAADLVVDLGDHLLDQRLVGDVEVPVGDGHAGGGGELLGRGAPGLVVDVGQHDRRAVLGEAAGHRQAEALGAAGDQRGAAGEIEEGGDAGSHGCRPSGVGGAVVGGRGAPPGRAG